eukprot:symbB.v1.2.021135.t1/scaffold1811.1/size100373/3
MASCCWTNVNLVRRCLGPLPADAAAYCGDVGEKLAAECLWKAGVDAKDSAMSSHAECQTFECDFSCTRCELKSRELDKVLGELLTEQKKAVSRSTEVQEARSQLTGARERLVELGSEVREQKLQNSVQAQRLERALKEWNSSETERRRSECQVRVLEQELDKLRQEVCHLRLQVSCARAADAESTEQKTTAPTVPPVPLPVSRTPVKRVSLPGAVMNKARHLEEKVREDSSRTSLPVTQERGEVKRSPNTQMREKMAQARRRLEQKMPEAEPASELPRPGEPEQDSQAKVSTTSRSPSNSTTSLSPRNASEIPI